MSNHEEWSLLVEEYEKFHGGSIKDFLKKKKLSMKKLKSFIPKDIEKIYFETLEDDKVQEAKEYHDRLVDSFLLDTDGSFVSLMAYCSKNSLLPSTIAEKLNEKSLKKIISSLDSYCKVQTKQTVHLGSHPRSHGLLKYAILLNDIKLEGRKMYMLTTRKFEYDKVHRELRFLYQDHSWECSWYCREGSLGYYKAMANLTEQYLIKNRIVVTNRILKNASNKAEEEYIKAQFDMYLAYTEEMKFRRYLASVLPMINANYVNRHIEEEITEEKESMKAKLYRLKAECAELFEHGD